MVLATTRLDVNKAVRKRLGTRKASFAGSDETRELTGMAIGGVTPVGLPDDLPLWVDARVLERERIILGGGGRDRKVHAPPEILTALGAEVVEDLDKRLTSIVDSVVATAIDLDMEIPDGPNFADMRVTEGLVLAVKDNLWIFDASGLVPIGKKIDPSGSLKRISRIRKMGLTCIRFGIDPG